MTGTRHRTDHQSRLDRWRRQIQRQQKTKLTIADFCRQLGVSVPTFDYGKRRIHGSPCTPFGRLPVGHSSPHPFTPAAVAADLARRLLRELSATRLKVAVGTVAAMAMAMLAAGIRLTDSHAGPPAVAGRARTGPDDRGADSLPKFARARLGDLRFYHGEWVRAPSTRPTAGPWSRSTSRAGSASGTPPPAGPIGRSATRPSGSASSPSRRMGRPWRPTTRCPGCSSGTWRPAANSGDGTSPGRAPTVTRGSRPTAGPSPSSPPGRAATRNGSSRPSSSWSTRRSRPSAAGGLRGAGRICGTSGSRPTGEPWRRPATIRPPRMGRP